MIPSVARRSESTRTRIGTNFPRRRVSLCPRAWPQSHVRRKSYILYIYVTRVRTSVCLRSAIHGCRCTTSSRCFAQRFCTRERCACESVTKLFVRSVRSERSQTRKKTILFGEAREKNFERDEVYTRVTTMSCARVIFFFYGNSALRE